ncbi:tRNA intron endonuclease, catalytic domain-like [Dillenia turbinata]|uniref:tRNA-intron lyase n=1 Tax=Dillenia turbinata TaxID=194707 RepID=A0AAN8V3H7_9MAGN
MGPRWKGKNAEAQALADPMSKIVSQLQSSLIQSDSRALLSGNDTRLEANSEQANLLIRSCFGQPIWHSMTADSDKQWFQLGFEEAFFMCYSLKCIKIVGEDNCPKNAEEVWHYMKSCNPSFPYLYKAYLHLRLKNWVVRPGLQYGGEFVAYRHHPSFVHSEFVVLVSSEENGDANGRLKVWSDLHCAVRLSGGVAKTLLVLHISKHGESDSSTSFLDGSSVDELTIARWSAEQSREDLRKTK